MKKYLIVASNERSYLDLKNIVLELKERNIPYFFLYSNSSERLFPNVNLDQFNYDTNIESDAQYPSKTLGFNLPFKPDVLLITNENWEPEKGILWEFKQWGTFIGCIENSSWMHNNIKCKLEIASRKSFPTNCIDVFFEHSKWGLESKTISGWWGQKSVVVGNPKYDDFTYDKNKSEDIIIVYGSMEIEHHNKILNIYKHIVNKYPNWEVYYKPHPTELTDFKNDFQNVKLIKDNNHFLEVVSKSKHNIGIFSSIMFYPLIMDKNVITLEHESVGISEELNIETFSGYKFNFWKGVLGFNTFQDFKDFIGEDFIKKIKKRNKELTDNINLNLVTYDKDCTFMNKLSNSEEVISYFDEFNDNKASERIINYIENE